MRSVESRAITDVAFVKDNLSDARFSDPRKTSSPSAERISPRTSRPTTPPTEWFSLELEESTTNLSSTSPKPTLATSPFPPTPSPSVPLRPLPPPPSSDPKFAFEMTLWQLATLRSPLRDVDGTRPTTTRCWSCSPFSETGIDPSEPLPSSLRNSPTSSVQITSPTHS